MTKKLHNLRLPINRGNDGWEVLSMLKQNAKRAILYSCLTGVLMLLSVLYSYAHVTEIRVNQAQDGTLTWYLVSYHQYNECGIANSGLTVNGVNYPLQSSNPGDASTLSSNIFAQDINYVTWYGRVSYAIVKTPFLGTNLSVQPYSSNVCYAFMVGGNGNFTPPPPPVCTTSPLTGWSNTVAASGNNQGTFCNPTDDIINTTIKVNHLACANITGDKQFRVVFDPAGADISYGPFNYGSGVETDVNISIPYGTSNSTQVKVIDDDFPSNIIHGLSIPNGQYLGERDSEAPTITRQASNLTVECDGAGNVPELQAWLKGLGGTPDPTCSSTSNFFWSNPPVANGNQATGTINGVNYTYTSSRPVTTTPDLFSHSTFPSTYGIPNQRSIKNEYISTNTLTFDKPVYNPILVFSSIGQGSVFVPIEFSNPVSIVWKDNRVAVNSPTRITGNEGFTIVRMDGVFSSISFNYLANENYVNFAFGADFPTLCATGGATATDNCSPVTWNNNYTGMNGNSTTVVFTAKDASNNTSSTTATFTIVDTKPPVITAPAAVYVNTDKGSCDATNVTLGNAVTSNNCGGVVVTNDAPSTFPKGTTTVTWTATDAAGNKATATQTVTVTDAEKPTIAAPIAVSVSTDNGSCNATNVALGNAIANDNCNGIVVTNNAPSIFPKGTTAVTWTATDATGNTETATQTVTVTDNQAPITATSGTKVITIPAGQSTNWNMYTYNFADPLPAGATITGITLTYSGKDQGWGGSGQWTRMIVSGTQIGGNQFWQQTQNFTINYSGSIPGYKYGGNNFMRMDFDTWPGWVAYFNGGTMTIHYQNSSIPTITAECAATVTTVPTASDNCAGTITGTTTDPLTYTTQGTHTITWNFNDGNGNTSSATQKVIISDLTPPIAKAQNLTVQLDAAGNGSITASKVNNGSNDACGIASLALDKTDFTCSNIGANTVKLTVTDNNGNVSTTTAVVTVKDEVAPIAKAQNLTVQLDASGNGSITASQVNSGSNDACGIASLALDNTTFNRSNIGENTVTLTVTDNNGNVSKTTAVVTVKDEVAPIAKAQNLTVKLDANGNGSITADQINNGSSDACGVKILALDKTDFTCSNIGANTVTLTVTDINGYESTVTAVVTVKDEVAPIAKSKNITVQLDASGNASIVADQINDGSSDACSIKSIVASKTEFDCSNVGENTAILTVTDNNGNESTTTAVITVRDEVAPVAKAQNISVTLVNGEATITAAQVNSNSTDACGIKTLALDKTTFNCSNLGNNPVTLTVTDVNGNVSTATATVNVIGVIPTPSITVKPSSSVYTGAGVNTIFLGYGAQSVTLAASNPTSATYSWSDVAGLSSNKGANPVFMPTAAGVYFFTVTATNEYGCQESSSVAITVIDARCGNKNDKVLVCHKGKEICIAPSAVQAHLAHGCSIGACNANASQSVATTGTSAAAQQEEMVAFPNPFSNQTNVEFTMKQDGKYRLELYDMKGALISVVAEGQGEANSYYSFEINGNKLPEGMYVARLITANGVQNAKIIKKK